jgi:hypothetical protein
MDDNEKIQNEDEISLLDLFTVLLRYRKLIVGITLLSIILAITGYFIYPVYKYNNAMKESLLEGRIIISIKQSMLSFVSKNPENFINRADVVMDSLREAGMDEFKYSGNKKISLTNEVVRTRALYLINQILILNKSPNGRDYNESRRIFQVITNTTKDVKTVVKDNYSIEIIYKNKEPEFIRSFFRNLIINGNKIAEDYIRSFVETIVDNYEQIMDGTYTGISWQNAMGGNLFLYAYGKEFLEGKETILSAIGDPIITEPDISLASYKSSYKLKSIIIVFAGFFLSIIIAFVLNVIFNLKNNEEAMKKIRDAWGNSGGK